MVETVQRLTSLLFGESQSSQSGGVNQGTSPIIPEHAIPTTSRQPVAPAPQETGTPATTPVVTGESRGTETPQPSGEQIQDFVPMVTLQDGSQVPASEYIASQQVTLSDGTQTTLDDLRAGYMRQGDYTQKTQALAEERRQVESQLEYLQQQGANLITGTPQEQAQPQQPDLQLPTIQLDEYASDAERSMAQAIQQQNAMLNQMTQNMQQLQGFVQSQHAAMVDSQLTSTMREAAVAHGLVNPDDYRGNPTGLSSAISQAEEEMSAIANQFSLFDDPSQMALAAEVAAARRAAQVQPQQQAQLQQQEEVQRRLQQQNNASVVAPTTAQPAATSTTPDISAQDFKNERTRQQWLLQKYKGRLATGGT